MASIGKIDILKSVDGNPLFPVTHESAVRDSNGVTLQTKLSLKQDFLVSGENIKTINDTSLLGSGNITMAGGIIIDDNPESGSNNAVKSGGVFSALAGKQQALVSGSNIKTINGSSILGEGNMILATDTSDCEKSVNKVTTITGESTDTQYPSAHAVYAYVYGATQNLISLPIFTINQNMHLVISSPDEDSLSLFNVDQSGHLVMTIDN